MVAIASISAVTCFCSAHAQAGVDYLNGTRLGMALPEVPKDPAVIELELTTIRAAQAAASATVTDEAIVDAKAFDPDLLLGRFSDAAQEPLSAASRPLLMRLLTRALPEVGHYSEAYKKVAERPRPYVEDQAIKLCYDSPSYPLNPQRSYPSGHAANGYAAALLLAEVFPARRQQILARGIRYGENRLVCGAHHPSDVLQGQLVAIAYFQAVSKNRDFESDLICARAEETVIERKLTSLPATCEH